jgi:hypothetical protein
MVTRISMGMVMARPAEASSEGTDIRSFKAWS